MRTTPRGRRGYRPALERLEARDCPAFNIYYYSPVLLIRGHPTAPFLVPGGWEVRGNTTLAPSPNRKVSPGFSLGRSGDTVFINDGSLLRGSLTAVFVDNVDVGQPGPVPAGSTAGRVLGNVSMTDAQSA